MKRSDLEQIIREEIEAALQEALPVRGDLTPGEPMKAKSPVEKQVEKIGSLSQIKQLVRRLPSRPAKDMADIIMTIDTAKRVHYFERLMKSNKGGKKFDYNSERPTRFDNDGFELYSSDDGSNENN